MGDFVFHDRTGKAFYPVGLQAHNSSTGTPWIKEAITATKLVEGNTMEAPVYWYQLEPQEDVYDSFHVKLLIDEARRAGLHLILLWFATSKNGHPNYVPEYVKLQPQVYRLAEDTDGTPIYSMSVHCRETLERDKKAFCFLMDFLKEYDGDEGTVIAVQVENEMGYYQIDRDYSDIGEADYRKDVPAFLHHVDFDEETSQLSSDIDDDGILVENEDRRQLDMCSNTPWEDYFGYYAAEAFSAYYTAKYINEIAQAGKKIYNIPMTVNVMLGENSIREPGLCYNTGAPVSRVLQIWKLAATAIDVIGPDMYVETGKLFDQICESYNKHGNSLYIPESPRGGMANAMNLIRAAGDHDAIGLFAFGAENMLDPENLDRIRLESEDLALSLQIISRMAPLLQKYRGTGRILAITEEEFEHERFIPTAEFLITAKYMRYQQLHLGYTDKVNRFLTKKWRARGILVQVSDYEYFLSGAGLGLDFVKRQYKAEYKHYKAMGSRAYSQLNFLSVEEGHFDETGEWHIDARRNGDETNFSQYVCDGEVIHIRLNPQM